MYKKYNRFKKLKVKVIKRESKKKKTQNRKKLKRRKTLQNAKAQCRGRGL